jgi:hypothetical protein
MKIRMPRHLGAGPNAEPAGQLPLAATEEEPHIAAIPIDGTQFCSFLADVATNAWKGQLRLAQWPGDELLAERKRLERNFESILSGLESFGVRVKDHTGEAYDYGQALKVVAAQPQDGIAREVVTETIRPTVYWRGHIIQRGEVVIATPHEEG